MWASNAPENTYQLRERSCSFALSNAPKDESNGPQEVVLQDNKRSAGFAESAKLPRPDPIKAQETRDIAEY